LKFIFSWTANVQPDGDTGAMQSMKSHFTKLAGTTLNIQMQQRLTIPRRFTNFDARKTNAGI
jgi:hypothetical protein